MGSPDNETGRYENEGPLHPVTLPGPYLLGKTEVTVGQFRRFIENTGYRTDAEKAHGSFLRDARSGQWRLVRGVNWRHDHTGAPAADDMPVVHVSWRDAQAYVQWLSAQTGHTYRLPSEAELEYANRAGTQTRFWWGDGSPQLLVANLRGEIDLSAFPAKLRQPTPGEYNYVVHDGPTELYFENYGDGHTGAAPVGSFAPNPFGLYDTTGNVWEWTQDCWHDDYTGAPTDGSAWTFRNKGQCRTRVLRGGSWYCFPRHLRSANRYSESLDFRNMYIGFRVARDL